MYVSLVTNYGLVVLLNNCSVFLKCGVGPGIMDVSMGGMRGCTGRGTGGDTGGVTTSDS